MDVERAADSYARGKASHPISSTNQTPRGWSRYYYCGVARGLAANPKSSQTRNLANSLDT